MSQRKVERTEYSVNVGALSVIEERFDLPNGELDDGVGYGAGARYHVGVAPGATADERRRYEAAAASSPYASEGQALDALGLGWVR